MFLYPCVIKYGFSTKYVKLGKDIGLEERDLADFISKQQEVERAERAAVEDRELRQIGIVLVIRLVKDRVIFFL